MAFPRSSIKPVAGLDSTRIADFIKHFGGGEQRRSLTPRQSCSTDASCSSAADGISVCGVSDGQAAMEVLSCFCRSYNADLGQCLYDGCGGDYQRTFGQLLDACDLYIDNDISDAEDCLASGDLGSSYCQLAAQTGVATSTPTTTSISTASNGGLTHSPTITGGSGSTRPTSTSGSNQNGAAGSTSFNVPTLVTLAFACTAGLAVLM